MAKLETGQAYPFEFFQEYAVIKGYTLTSAGTGNNNEGGEFIILTKAGTNTVISAMLIDSEDGLFEITYNKIN